MSLLVIALANGTRWRKDKFFVTSPYVYSALQVCCSTGTHSQLNFISACNRLTIAMTSAVITCVIILSQYRGYTGIEYSLYLGRLALGLYAIREHLAVALSNLKYLT